METAIAPPLETAGLAVRVKRGGQDRGEGVRGGLPLFPVSASLHDFLDLPPVHRGRQDGGNGAARPKAGARDRSHWREALRRAWRDPPIAPGPGCDSGFLVFLYDLVICCRSSEEAMFISCLERESPDDGAMHYQQRFLALT